MKTHMRHKAYIGIFSDQITATEISKILNLKYTREHKKGDKRIKDNRCLLVFKENAWILDSKLKETETFNEHFKHLLNRFKATRNQLKTLLKKKCFLQCTGIYEGDASPILSFEPKVLSMLGNLNLNLEIDIVYC